MLPMILFLLSQKNKNSLKKGYVEMANFCFLDTSKKVSWVALLYTT